MLPRPYRLTAKKDFNALYRFGIRAEGRGPLHVIALRKHFGGETPTVRFGIVIAKTYSKKATARNRLRRRIREVLARVRAAVAGSWDVVVIVRPSSSDLSYQECAQLIQRSMKRIGILAP